MAQPFNFGFHDDDIESDHAGEDDMDAEPGEPAKPLTVHDDQGLLEPRVWDLDEMVGRVDRHDGNMAYYIFLSSLHCCHVVAPTWK
jgi:hypothetical protein